MNSSELKDFLITSLNSDSDPLETSARLEKEGLSYDFSKNFNEKVLDRLFMAGYKVTRENEFIKSLNLAFSRIALTGVAAIVVMLISIFLMEGSISFNSFLGLNDSYDESIISLLTGI
jgi:hypothetical protein